MFLEEFNNVYPSLLDRNLKYNFLFKPKLTLGDNGVFYHILTEHGQEVLRGEGVI